MVGVSIVSHGHWMYLPVLVNSLALNELITSIVIRVNDPSLENLQCLDRLENEESVNLVFNEQKLGFGANHNLNVNLIQEDYILILNPDTILKKLSQVGDLVVPVVLDENGSASENGRKFITPYNMLMRLLRINPGLGSDWFGGMGILVSRKVFNLINGFDEAYFMYVEDCDFFWRLSKLNIKPSQNTEFVILHFAQKSSHKSLTFFKFHFMSVIRFWSKRYLKM